MAKKAKRPVEAVADDRTSKPVRLDLSLADHARLEAAARRRGLSKASTVRMVLLAWLDAQEGKRE